MVNIKAAFQPRKEVKPHLGELRSCAYAFPDPLCRRRACLGAAAAATAVAAAADAGAAAVAAAAAASAGAAAGAASAGGAAAAAASAGAAAAAVSAAATVAAAAVAACSRWRRPPAAGPKKQAVTWPMGPFLLLRVVVT